MTRPIRIGVVDDHGRVHEALRQVLDAQPGFQVVGGAQDPDGAVTLVETHEPDLVLMDVRMPGGGGAEATRRIREHNPLTRVVALSAHEDRISVLEMLRAGAVGYVTKGAPVEELVSAIRSAVEGGRPLSASVTVEVAAELAERLSWEEYDARHSRRQRALLEAALRVGVRPVYQPIFDLASGALAGLEALARFPADPAVPVPVWFAAAAEAGLGPELELAAIRAALAGARDRPRDVYLAVNVSPACLGAPVVVEALTQTDLSGVVLELTEHARVTDYGGLAELLAPLRAGGARPQA
ncbi:MAG TPA: response regulator, partial [Egibacteraceae bacterium]|nr:response regulator [Egibacteraceae bacterium]